MNSSEIFTLALGLAEPWYVSKVELIEGEQSKKELHLWLSFTRGYRFTFGTKEYTTYDTIDKTWRHLNFFEHLCYIHANVPRVQTEENKTIMVEVPWARKNSGFTLLFEAYSMLLIEREMPVSSVSQTMHVTDPRIWRVFNHWVHTFLQTVYKFIFRHDAMVYCSFHSDGLQPPVLSPPPTLLLLLAPSQARLSSQRR